MTALQDFIASYWKGFNNLFPISTIQMQDFFLEDSYGGYPSELGGSVWESEGRALYVMIRVLKPRNILEIGNFKGCSANHILQAVEMNRAGYSDSIANVTLLDISEQLDYPRLHNENFNRVLMNSVEFLSQWGYLNYDLYVIDGNHSYEHTKRELELIIAHHTVPFYVWAHDYHVTHDPSCQVRRTWDEMKHHFAKFETFKDSVSNCGFVIAKYEPK